MDWTGGTRRRFARGGGKSVVQRQKAHFAKVRNRLQNGLSSRSSHPPESFGDMFGTEQRAYADQHGSTEGRSQLETLAVKTDTHRQTSQQERARPHKEDHRSRTRNSVSPGGLRIHDGLRSARGTVPSPTHARPASDARPVSNVKPVSNTRSKESTWGRNRAASVSRPNSMALPSSREPTEEDLLLANRRRLLAHSDWLGLAAARPVRMKFPSSRDKDRIGKRRKIEKTATTRSRPAEHRELPPLFNERLVTGEELMSGVLQHEEDISIRIGDAALVSQTNQSSHLHHVVEDSIRPGSSELGHLSQESMLLGEDGDPFEAEVEADPENNAIAVHGTMSTGRTNSMMARAGTQASKEADCRVAQSPESVWRASPDDELRSYQPEEPDGQVMQHYENHCHSEQEMVPDSGPDHLRYTPQDPRLLNQLRQDIQCDRNSTSGDDRSNGDKSEMLDRAEESAAEHGTEPGDNPLDDDDETWRCLMEIRKYTSSRQSVAVLRSSSQHLSTTSHMDSAPKAVLDAELGGQQSEAIMVSTPHGAGTLVASQDQHLPDATQDATSTVLQSPSASFKQIIALTQERAPPRQALKDEEDDSESEALWRKFVFGSGRTVSSHSVDENVNLDRAGHRDEEEEDLSSASFHQASDQATAGGTLFFTGKTSSSPRRDYQGRHIATNQDDRNNYGQTSTAANCAESNLEYDVETDEQWQPTSTRKSQGNIHAVPILDGRKRFKPTKKAIPPAPPRRPDQFIKPTNRRHSRQRPRSVYDLIDSDGNSVF